MGISKMSKIEASIEVDVPAQTAYEYWSRFEEIPIFMQGVECVRQLDERRLCWRAEVGGEVLEWEAEITELIPAKRIAWRSLNGVLQAGAASFFSLDDERCRVALEVNYRPEGVVETVEDWLGVMSLRTAGDLDRFQEVDRRAGGSLNLIVLPSDGLAPILRALRKAKESVRITLFRCDLPEVEKALAAAVARGVAVHALIAQTNRAGEKLLRKLELRLLEGGITVSRTADDLVRYHNKMLVIDERVLFVFGFNFTRLDLSKRRSMAIVTRKRPLVAEALELFEADVARQEFAPGKPKLVISPVNARARIEKLVGSARRSLRIYDPQAIDAAMLRLLQKKAAAGVDVRIIGKVGKSGRGLRVEALPSMGVHLRAILRDDIELFVGSQGLRSIELDRRRELGIIVRDRGAIKHFRGVFDDDWATTKSGREERKERKERKAA